MEPDDVEVTIPLAPDLRLAGGLYLATNLRPVLMGIVNVTPDSFGTLPLYPDGHPETALAYARQLHNDGADIIDLGAESTRPGAEGVDDEEQLTRLLPVVKGCVAEGMIVSVDTRSARVANAVLEAGAHLINDVSGLSDPGVVKACVAHNAAYVLMHTRATPKDMQAAHNLDYPQGIVDAVDTFFHQGVQTLLDLGLEEDQIVIDPGFGFAKTAEHNYELMQNLLVFTTSGLNVLVGISRKSFIGKATGIENPLDRDPGSVALSGFLAMMGGHIHRVHNVAHTYQAMRVMRALDQGQPADWPSVIVQ